MFLVHKSFIQCHLAYFYLLQETLSQSCEERKKKLGNLGSNQTWQHWSDWLTGRPPVSHRPRVHMSHRHVTVDVRMEDLVYLDRGQMLMRNGTRQVKSTHQLQRHTNSSDLVRSYIRLSQTVSHLSSKSTKAEKHPHYII
ncbi:hypothetical protein E2C01_021395 [Portunus trituberculatus]|uniref:Uncharacterized protein n=1 Tax=Portunus trituberculatus TaxID=210409 RepID=A0A5B7E452_PORTR|nr:hypothetical protein [Portunus trituberculatus]